MRGRATPALRLGADIGGTFTDVVLLDPPTGRVTAVKVLTTPDDPLRAVLAGLAEVLERSGSRAADVVAVVHGTTLAINALIERKGARTALLTTAGFRDVLETGRELRYDLYTLDLRYPVPLVPRRWRLPVVERMDAAGVVVTALDLEALEGSIDVIEAAGIEAVAVCLLHSYANPAHEKAVAEALLRRLPRLHVSISSDVLPQIGEYPRVSTTVANAYIRPMMGQYLSRMADELAALGLPGTLSLVASNGGLADVAHAVEVPAALIESGPAAGLTAAGIVARAAGRGTVLAFDMGGTTAKLCLVRDGLPSWTAALEVARTARFQRGSGLPIALPSVDLIEIGAGGGSIARLDGMGMLEVGPDSAGSVPGPACYGRGGIAPTVTDANLVLGFLSPGFFAGGSMALSLKAAEAALEPMARRLGRTVAGVAADVFEAVSSAMADAARVHAAEMGVDVRRTAIVAFGGAGPLHAWRMAQLLGVPSVIVPASPGVLSALGCVLAPTRCDLSRAFVAGIEGLGAGALAAVAGPMQAEADRRLGLARVAPGARRYAWSLDMKYVGQRYTINVPMGSGPSRVGWPSALRAVFEAAYRARYGRTVAGVDVAIEAIRLTGTGPSLKVGRAAPEAELATVLPSVRSVRFGGEEMETAVYRRSGLRAGAGLFGPAIVEDEGSTIVVPPGAAARLDGDGHMHIDLGVEAHLDRAGGMGRSR